jgi:cbb3-type cytochrome oxidase subunit 3
MMRSVMENAGLTFWPILSLAVFGIYAMGVVAWLFRKGSKDFYTTMSSMAMEERQDGKQG